MSKYTFKKELDTTDLIKSAITVLGAIFAFSYVTLTQLHNEEIKTNLELTKQIPKLQPFVQSNISNRINPDNKNEIEIKLYLNIKSEHYLYFFPPKISLVKKGTKNCLYTGKVVYKGVESYKGLFSPGTEYNIRYSIETPDEVIDIKEYELLLSFDVETDDKIQKAYSKALNSLDDDITDLIDKLSYKTHTFRDRIYLKNKNFESFFSKAQNR